jgi:hypothetical protein
MENDIQNVVLRDSSKQPLDPLATSASVTSPGKKSKSRSTTAKEKKKKKKSSKDSVEGCIKPSTTIKKKKKLPSKPLNVDPTLVTMAAAETIPADNKQKTTTEPPHHQLRTTTSRDESDIVPDLSGLTMNKGKTKTKRSKDGSKENHQNREKNSKPQQLKPTKKEEETRKRRERLMVSPFDYLQVKHFEPPQDDVSCFRDDISHLTLPKPLRELEKKYLKDMTSTPPFREETPVSYPALMVSSLLADQAAVNGPDPGWSRKAKPERKSRSPKTTPRDTIAHPATTSASTS